MKNAALKKSKQVAADAAPKKPVSHLTLIAKQAEEACHLPGNHNDPDFDEFEAKYGLGGFA